MIPWADGAYGAFAAGGKSLEYACYGPGPADAPTLILLHEGLGCVALWRDFPRQLQATTGWGVFVYSRQGYGKSDLAELPRPLDYMTYEATDVLPEVLTQIGLQRGALLGHSDGGTIAAIHAGLIQDPRVCAAVLIAPHFFTEPMGLAAIVKARHAFDQGDLAAKLGKFHKDAAHTFDGWCNAWLHPDFEHWSVLHVLKTIQVPVLAIQGSADAYGTYAQIDAIREGSPAPVSLLKLAGASHAPHFDETYGVIDRIATFLGIAL